MSRKDQSLTAIFGVPVLLAVLSLIGLIGALLADGAWDWIGAALLAAPVAVIALVRVRRRRPDQAPGSRALKPEA